MADRMTIKKSGGKYVIRARSPRVKQVFFGWADGRENPEFYGRDVGEWGGDWTTWEWKLTKAKVEKLLLYIGLGFSEGYYDSKQEKQDHRYVMKKLAEKIGVEV